MAVFILNFLISSQYCAGKTKLFSRQIYSQEVSLKLTINNGDSNYRGEINLIEAIKESETSSSNYVQVGTKIRKKRLTFT
jgi:hypothetical protein